MHNLPTVNMPAYIMLHIRQGKALNKINNSSRKVYCTTAAEFVRHIPRHFYYEISDSFLNRAGVRTLMSQKWQILNLKNFANILTNFPNTLRHQPIVICK